MNWFNLGAVSSVALAISLATAATAVETIRFEPLMASASTELTELPMAAIQIAQATAGQFITVDQDHPTTGTAQIVTENGQRYLVLDQEFDTARGPAVEVILYRDSTVPVNIAAADYVTIAPLQSFSGPQRYLIPAEIDLNSYAAVGIWCRQFNVTFGYASL